MKKWRLVPTRVATSMLMLPQEGGDSVGKASHSQKAVGQPSEKRVHAPSPPLHRRAAESKHLKGDEWQVTMRSGEWNLLSRLGSICVDANHLAQRAHRARRRCHGLSRRSESRVQLITGRLPPSDRARGDGSPNAPQASSPSSGRGLPGIAHAADLRVEFGLA